MALPTNANANFSVAIIGAGLGGLQLARVLQQRGVHTTVYEREISPISRNQGGTLDLHPESGQRALQMAGLSEEFRKIAHPEADATRIVDKTGRITFDDEEVTGPPGGAGGSGRPDERLGEQGDEHQSLLMEGRPEVDRGELRQILLDSLLPNTVLWGYNLSSCQLVDNDKVELHFEEQPQLQAATVTATFDLVVGADGTWSRVRPLVSSVKPEYTGVQFLDIQLTNIDGTLPEVSKLVGRGSLFALGDNRGLIAQRNSGGKVRVYVGLRAPLSWPESSGISALVAEEQFSQVQELLLSEYFEDWSVELRSMISSADLERSSFAVRPLMMLPVDHEWKSIGRVTLLGDAAHVMSPFAGEGANLAMLDAAELGEAIATYLKGDRGAVLVDLIGKYEKRMLARSKEKSEESIRNQNLFMAENAAARVGDLMRQLMSGGPLQP